MQSVSASWGAIFNAPHKVEYRFDIAGATYYGENVKGTPVIVKPLIDKPAIGRVCTGFLKLSIYPKSTNIPKAAAVDAYCRLRNTTDGSASEWLRQGRYYITTRTGKDVINLSCLDRMVKAGITYRDNSRITEWPAPMTDVVDEICDVMGVSLDSRTVIKTGSDYVVSYPNDDVLISEVLGMIAAAHGGNWIMTETGNLRLVVLSAPKSTVVQVVGKSHKGFTSRGKTQTVSQVILKDSANNEFIAGDETGLTISVKCDYATQDIANDLCSASAPSTLYGIQYEPYAADGAYLNPAVELGDTLFFTDKDGTVHRVVAHTVNMNCTVACTCSLSALIDDETENEYPYKSPRDLTLERTVRTDQTYFGNSITRKEGFKSELASGAFARFNADGMDFVDENGKRCLYYDADEKTFVFDGSFQSQSVVTETIYAEYGDVAELTVDRLATHKMVANYLLGSTDDVNYVNIQDRTISFITGTYSGGTVQHQDRSGRSLWWVKDITTAYIDGNGVPWTDSTQTIRITMSTDLGDANTDGYVLQTAEPEDWETNWTAYYRYTGGVYVRITDATAPAWATDTFFSRTRWPVMVYTYSELTKMKLSFEMDSDINTYVPVIEIGAGNQSGYNKCRIYKGQDAMRIMYTNASGSVNEISHASSENFWRINGYGFLPVASLPATQLQDVVYFTPAET